MGKYSEEAYRKTVDSIFTRYPSVQKVPFGEAYKPGLSHIERFCAILGDPQSKFRTIHVAGTNGKGSVANMLASVLSSAGLKVGLYTSPHIVDFRERVRTLTGENRSLSGVEGPVVRQAHQPVLVPKEYVFDFLTAHEPDFDALDLSFFEITTGLAFKWFADEEVDVAVIEVGLGGRLDSTNIIIPDLAVVTSIALDHCAILGDTLQQIAFEKAGIFKRGVPALVGEYLPETRPVFERQALETGCPLTFAEDDNPSMKDRTGRILAGMDLQGKYQSKNLGTVLSAVDILKENPFYSNLDDADKVEDAIVHTARRAGFHGRWEKLSEDPTVIADIGHNPAALKENFAQLEAMMETGKYSSLIIVYAVMADKDFEGIIPLMPEDAVYIFTNPKIKRALPEEELTAAYKAFCRKRGRPTDRVYDSPSVAGAIDMALRLAGDSGALIYVGGSTYLVSEAVEILRPMDDEHGF